MLKNGDLTSKDFADRFTELALQYDCDKVIDHDYARFYAEIFVPINADQPRLLEIGVGGYADPLAGGASLHMWHHLLPEWSIVAIDVTRKKLSWPDHVTFICADQSNPDHLDHIGKKYGPFDVIIDDGSHVNKHVRASLWGLFPYLKEGGTYVIEDVQTSYLGAYGGSLSRDADTTANLARDLFDFVNAAELPSDFPIPAAFRHSVEEVRFQHNVVSVRKKTANRISNLQLEGVEKMLMQANEILADRHEVGRWLRLARYLSKLKRFDEARQCLRAGQQQFPDSIQIKRALATLEVTQNKNVSEKSRSNGPAGDPQKPIAFGRL
ncbi:tetratricopeptide repeat protein [Sphingobium yanoikuyae]|uniref:tetratricopeptide repeat protein n=1 Tax=Sphingobium yanoikuyae TaxID=13690 RepID=UPI003F0EDE58